MHGVDCTHVCVARGTCGGGHAEVDTGTDRLGKWSTQRLYVPQKRGDCGHGFLRLSSCGCAALLAEAGLDGHHAALAAALRCQCGCAARPKRRVVVPLAEARVRPASACSLLTKCRKPPARGGVSSARCGVRRRTTESACLARRATVPWKSDACVNPTRLDVHSL